jgi:hypothetical protein
MNSYDLRLESGLSPLDLPQKFVVSANYQIPVGKGQRFASSHPWVNQIVGGWEINGIGTIRSGLPTDVLTGSLPPVFATINRHNVVLGQSTLVPNPGFDQYFNRAAFSVPATVLNARGTPITTFGNASRMVLRGPGSKNLDFSLFKNFNVTERTQVQFRAEAFNHQYADFFASECEECRPDGWKRSFRATDQFAGGRTTTAVWTEASLVVLYRFKRHADNS